MISTSFCRQSLAVGCLRWTTSSRLSVVSGTHKFFTRSINRPTKRRPWRCGRSCVSIGLEMAEDNGEKETSKGVPEVPGSMEHEAQLLEKFFEAQTISRVSMTKPSSKEEPINITVQYSQKNLPANSSRKYMSTITLMDQKNLESFGPASVPTELADASMISTSPSGKRMVVAKKSGENDGACFEIWEKSRVTKTIHVPKSFHGNAMADGFFGTKAGWNPDETRIVYVAESPATEKTPEWGGSNGKEGPGPKGWRGKGAFEDDWGEQRDGLNPSAIFVMDVDSGSIEALSGLPDDCSCGQPVWSRDGKHIIFVAWNHKALNFNNTALKLGFVYCTNRPCSLYCTKFPQDDKDSMCITPSLATAHNPRFSPSGDILVFVSHDNAAESGTHSATATVHKLDWKQEMENMDGPDSHTFGQSLSTVVETVQSPESAGSFPGLYVWSDAFIGHPFVDESTLVCSTIWGARVATISINVLTGKVERIDTSIRALNSLTIVTMGGSVALAVESGFDTPRKLMIAHIGSWNWVPVDSSVQVSPPDEISSILKEFVWEPFVVKPTVGPEFPLEALVFQKKGRSGPQPTILVCHGGPHSSITSEYYTSILFMVELGYTILTVNFRGSLGYGEKQLQSLPGNVGTYDVTDCIAALDYCIEKGWTDPDYVGVSGGSHGGFLTGHLVGQYPDKFKAAVLRNPVLNLAHMFHTTDIPDWIFAEVYGPQGQKDFKLVPSSEDLAEFLSKSPIHYVGNVKTPLLFSLGKKDRRVPISDALRYIAALRSRNDAPEVRVQVFPDDNHPLDKPQTMFEDLLSAAWWMKKHGVLKNSGD